MTAHTPHAADLIDLGCPRCQAQWEVIRATQADPLTVLDPEPAAHPERVIAWIAIAALGWLAAGCIVWRLIR